MLTPETAGYGNTNVLLLAGCNILLCIVVKLDRVFISKNFHQIRLVLLHSYYFMSLLIAIHGYNFHTAVLLLSTLCLVRSYRIRFAHGLNRNT